MSNTTFPMVAAARPRTLSPFALPCVEFLPVAAAAGTRTSWVDARGAYASAEHRTTGFDRHNSMNDSTTINSTMINSTMINSTMINNAVINDATVKQGRPPRGEPR